jgi:hypothetical protein
MRKTRLSRVLALALVLVMCMTNVVSAAKIVSNTLTAQLNVDASENNISLDDPSIFGDNGLKATNEKRYIGKGSWKATGEGEYVELYIDPSRYNLGHKRIKDIDYISYSTNKPDDEKSVDFFLAIYTKPYNGGDKEWYGHRLNAEPMYSKNINAPANEWNTWSTNGSNNQLRFFDGNHGPMGTYEDPTLEVIQEGSVTWQDGKAIDYREQEILYFKIGTGTAWHKEFKDAYLDDIQIHFKDSSYIKVDLEANAVQVALDAINKATRENMQQILEDNAGTLNLNMAQYYKLTEGGRREAVADSVKFAIEISGPFKTVDKLQEVLNIAVEYETHKMNLIQAQNLDDAVEKMTIALSDIKRDSEGLLAELLDNEVYANNFQEFYGFGAEEIKQVIYVIEGFENLESNQKSTVVLSVIDQGYTGSVEEVMLRIQAAIGALEPENLIILTGFIGNKPINEDCQVSVEAGDSINVSVTAKLAKNVEVAENIYYQISVRKQDNGSWIAAEKGDFVITKVNGEENTEGINNTFNVDGDELIGRWGHSEGFDFENDEVTTTMEVVFRNAGIYKVEICTIQVD